MSKIAATPASRKKVLDAQRRLKMAESAHAYVRGSTVRFYEWLQGRDVIASIPSGPDIWICGDCHTGNLGPVADLNGNIDIQIRDLDQTVIGNPAHDLLRLGLSLAMAARGSDLPGVTTALMMEELVVGYIAGLNGRRTPLNAKELAPIARVMRQAKSRRWRHLAEERIEDVEPAIPLGRKFWNLSKAERAELDRLVDDGGLQLLLAHIVDGDDNETVRLLDAAYWMKGCSSLGRLRYALLVGVGSKKSARYRLLDVKEATPAAVPIASRAKMPKNNAERVVAGAKALSPYLGNRMMAATISRKSVVIRELRPQDMKFELDGLLQSEAVAIARVMAGVVGRAHGRQMTAGERQTWKHEMGRRHGRGLDAPRWLWTSILDLVGLHEEAYLEHCRQYALGNAA